MNFDKLKFDEALQIYQDLIEFERSGHWNSSTPNGIPQWVEKLSKKFTISPHHPSIFSHAWRGVALALARYVSSRHHFD